MPDELTYGAWVTDAGEPVVDDVLRNILVPEWAELYRRHAIPVPAPGATTVAVPKEDHLAVLARYLKTPADTLRVVLDWTEWLAAQGRDAADIADFTVTAPGLTVAGTQRTGPLSVAWFAAGADGDVVTCTFRLDFADGGAVERSVQITVRAP